MVCWYPHRGKTLNCSWGVLGGGITSGLSRKKWAGSCFWRRTCLGDNNSPVDGCLAGTLLTLPPPPHLLCSSSSYLAPSPPLPAFITSPPPFFICPLFTVSLWPISCRWCDLYFLLNCVYHFKHLWEKRRGGGFVISFSQMILAPVLSSVWIKRFEWPFFQGSWYPAGGSINWAHFSQPTLQGRPPLKRSRRKKNLRIITNVTHIAIRLHLSHIDNRHFSSPRGSKWNYGRAYVTL